MGTRRNRNFITLFFLCTSVLIAVEIKVFPEKETNLVQKLIDAFVNNLPGLLLAGGGLYFNNLKEKKLLKQTWYNDIILNKLSNLLDDYIENLLNNLNSITTIEKKREVRANRTLFYEHMKLIEIYNKSILNDIKQLLLKTQDISTNDTLDIFKKKRELTKVKIDILKLLHSSSEITIP